MSDAWDEGVRQEQAAEQAKDRAAVPEEGERIARASERTGWIAESSAEQAVRLIARDIIALLQPLAVAPVAVPAPREDELTPEEAEALLRWGKCQSMSSPSMRQARDSGLDKLAALSSARERDATQRFLDGEIGSPPWVVRGGPCDECGVKEFGRHRDGCSARERGGDD